MTKQQQQLAALVAVAEAIERAGSARVALAPDLRVALNAALAPFARTS